jgi:chaperonin cofactor prefoldin
LKRISQGKSEDVFKLNSEREKLLKEISELVNQNNQVEMQLRDDDESADEMEAGLEDAQV